MIEALKFWFAREIVEFGVTVAVVFVGLVAIVSVFAVSLFVESIKARTRRP